MSNNYQTERLTKFKDIETETTQKKTLLQKIWSLNRASSTEAIINPDSQNVGVLTSSASTKQLNDLNTSKKLTTSLSKEKLEDSLISNENNQSNSDSFESNSIKIDNEIDNDRISLTSRSENKLQSSISDNKYNIPNVLKHVYTLMQRNTDPESSREFWMPDDQVKECFECNEKFTTFRRRHHCRVCGQIFCARCSDHEIPSQLIRPNTTGNIRVCTFCRGLVDQLETGDLINNKNSIKELMNRLSTPSPNLNSNSSLNENRSPAKSSVFQFDNNEVAKIGTNDNSKSSVSLNIPSNTASSNVINNSNKINNPFDITENKDYFKTPDNEITKLVLNNTSELRNLWIQIYHTSDGLQFQTRYPKKFKTINNCITNHELIEWLMRKKSVSRDQAIVIGQALVQGKWLQSATSSNSDHIFSEEFGYYKPGIAALTAGKIEQQLKKTQLDTEEGPEWVSELNKIVSSVEEEKILNQQSPQVPLQQQKQYSTPTLTQLSSQQILNKSNPIALSPLSLLNMQQQKLTNDENLLKPSNDDDTKSLSKLNQNFYSISSCSSTVSLASSPSMTPTPVPIAPITTPTVSNTNLLNNNLNNQNSSKIERRSNSDTGREIEYQTQLRNFNPNEDFQFIHKKLQLDLLQQLLKLHNLSFEWFDIILDLAWKAVDLVKPDIKHDNDQMDVRNYLKIKKLPGGLKQNCRIINGLVFTKNVAHKSMNTEMKNPKILLLRSSIEYQRVEEKLCSLQPLFIAESQYLKNNCSKLLKLNPDILIVERSVARIAQEFLLQSGVTLILNVKSCIMDKLSRFLQADCIATIEDIMRKPRLGFCTKFHVEKYQLSNDTDTFKPLMYFEGTPTNLGCTILLTGASIEELAVIKSLTNFMIYVAYNSKLEQSFLSDIYAFFTSQNALKETIPSTTQFNLDDTSPTNSETRTGDSITRKLIDEIKQRASAKAENKELNLVNYLFDSKDENGSSDEIHSLFNKNNLQNEEIKGKQFEYLINKLILSCSPFIKYKIPYLLSESGYKYCSLKKYVPKNYINFYNSNILSSLNLNEKVTLKINKNKIIKNNLNDQFNYEASSDSISSYEKKLKEPHEFLKIHLIKSASESEIKKIYADYRARGHRFELVPVQNIENNSCNNIEIDKDLSKSQIVESIDCLDVTNRQHIAVLFYSKCENSPVYPHICIKPRVIDMTFYNENDMTLGSFLARNCFRTGYSCTNELCNTLILNHTRYFVHSEYQIVIKMNIVPDELPITALPQINLNVNSNNNSIQNIQNSPKQVNDTVDASNSDPNKQSIKCDDINIYMWATCKKCQKSSKRTIMSPDTWSYSLGKFLELLFYAKDYKRNTKLGKDDYCKHSLFHQHDIYFRFKNMQTVFSYSQIKIRRLDLPPTLLKIKSCIKERNEYIDEIKDLSEKGLTLFSTLSDRLNSLKGVNLHEKQIQKLDQYINSLNSDTTLRHKIETINLLLTKSTINLNQKQRSNEDLDKIEQTTNSDTNNKNEIHESIDYNQIELLLIELKKYIGYNVNYWNNKMSDFLKKPKYDDAPTPDTVSELSTNGDTPKLPIKHDSDSKQTAQKEDECTLASNTGVVKFKKQTLLSETNDVNDLIAKQQIVNDQSIVPKSANTEYDDEHSKSTSISVKRIFANLLPSSSFQPLKLPFPEDDHFILNCESNYYINEKDLSSIVAFTLSSKDYKDFQSNVNKKVHQGNSSVLNGNSSSNNSNSSSAQNNSNNKDFITMANSIQDFDDVDTSNPNVKQQFTSDLHFDYQFHDLNTRFYCKVYYADLFYQLRKLLLPNQEEKYIHSLFRCMNWEAKGGKSNSQFRKTLDNRFVLKEMSKQEVQSFLDFAPKYIQYITSCIQNKRPTALTKIVGAYRICLMKNAALGVTKAVKIDVLVLENLFYTKKHTQVFDLKGSERNRLINTQGKQQEKELVLLDENFLRWSFDNPIYIKCHSKHVLMNAIAADTEFLSSKFVMDYSLLCGFDHINNQVVVGIIDYIRTFTWDKRLETFIKTFGAQDKMPTIVSPQIYRKRFISAIERYFIEVPDHWYQNTKDL